MAVHLVNIPGWAIWLCYGGATLAAVWGGSWPARLVAGSEFAQMFFHLVFCRLHACVVGRHYVHPWRYVVEDLVLLAIMVGCAATARRYWVIWAASLQLAGVGTDVLYIALKPTVGAWAYASASRIWTLLIFALVLWDVVLETRSRRAARQAATGAP